MPTDRIQNKIYQIEYTIVYIWYDIDWNHVRLRIYSKLNRRLRWGLDHACFFDYVRGPWSAHPSDTYDWKISSSRGGYNIAASLLRTSLWKILQDSVMTISMLQLLPERLSLYLRAPCPAARAMSKQLFQGGVRRSIMRILWRLLSASTFLHRFKVVSSFPQAGQLIRALLGSSNQG